jgi:hypothetical protein
VFASLKSEGRERERVIAGVKKEFIWHRELDKRCKYINTKKYTKNNKLIKLQTSSWKAYQIFENFFACSESENDAQGDKCRQFVRIRWVKLLEK